MKAKILASLASFLSFSGAVSAQISGESGNFGGVFASLTGVLRSIIGVETLSPSNMFYFAIGLGILWVTITIILETGLDKLGLGDIFQSSGLYQDGSKKLLYVLSLLITLTTVGTGAVTGLVAGLQSFFLLAVVSVVIALLVAVLFGLPSGALFGIGAGSKVLGKGTSYAKEGTKELGGEIDEAWKELEDASKKLEQAGKEEKEAAQKGNKREAKDAEQKLEQGIKEEKDSEDKTEDVLLTTHEQLSSTLTRLQKTEEEEQTEEEMLESIDRKLSKSAHRWDKNILPYVKDKSNWPINEGYFASGVNRPAKYGFAEFKDDMVDIVNKLSKLKKVEGEEEEHLRRDLNQLETELNELMEAHKLAMELKKDVEQTEKEERQMEKLNKQKFKDKELSNEIQVEEDQIETLEKELQDILNKDQEIRNELERAEKFLKKEIGYLEEEEQELEVDYNDIEQILERINDLDALLRKKGDNIMSSGVRKNLLEKLEGLRSKMNLVEETLKEIEKRKVQEEQFGKKVGKEIEEYLKKA